MERETGIEPATNSLEGCDSTTELLPPSRSRPSLTHATAGRPASRLAPFADSRDGTSPRALRHFYCSLFKLHPGLPTVARTRNADSSVAAARRRLVAREGLEPSKPLGRQIYSLLRLTASLPRLNFCVCGIRASCLPA